MGSSIEQSCSPGSSAPCVRSFTIVVADLRFTQCHHQPRRKKFKRSTLGSSLAGGGIAKLGIGHHDRETSAHDIFDPDEQLCSMEDLTFHCEV
ncbi:predicted protein [Lichtheimia corymbifera JMRC:FSU:9682]|uniref:Uncharacterized protein n=1 Tax=Lichtheimia corymbifera JMRC:FSU:9682 TaxID=1263082 RepID=A0A068SAV3_9FUNG|nr:predicted protein [Lichtheimia corymbifera JMRC:FSU:9682]